MPAAAAVQTGERRGGAMRMAIVLSLAAHLALLIWVYQWGPPSIRAATVERIIPIFVAPRQERVPPPPPPPAEVAPRAARPAFDPGGRTGAGSNTPAVPVRQPERVLEPEHVLPVPTVRNPAPEASTLVSNAGAGQQQGDGSASRAGPGQGEGAGRGPGVGQGSSPGGPASAPPGWVPEWRQLPNRSQVNGVYPKAAWAQGVSGGATLLCTVRVSGRVNDCTIIKEAPPGQGFGQAVLTLSRHFRITPRRVNGKAVETRLAIPYMMLMDPNVSPKRSPQSTVGGSSAPARPVQAPPPRR